MRSGIGILLLAAAAESWCVQFEPNQGQTDASVRYYARGDRGVVFLTDDAMIVHRADGGEPVRLRFVDALGGARWTPQGRMPGRTTYLQGRDPRRWAKDVPRYRRVVRERLYPRVDAVFYGTDGQLEYDLLVRPGARPADIRIAAEHALSLTADGALRIGGLVTQRRPVAYQETADGSRRPVEASYRLLAGNQFGFRIGSYDPGLPLVIDPVVETAAYLGGDGEDRIVGISDGARAGMTTSIDFPGAAFARRRGYDVFVQMPTSAGPLAVVVGGSGSETVTSVASSGTEVMVGGYTESTDLPTEFGASPNRVFQPEFQGGATDGFVFLVSSQRSVTYYLSYVGSPADDRVTAVGGMRGWQQFLVAGTTTGRGMERAWARGLTVPNLERLGGTDAFFMSVETGSGPRVSSFFYFGGAGEDVPRAAAPDFAGGFLVAGETSSREFPGVSATLGTFAGESDGFIVRLRPRSLDALRYIGGSAADRVDGLRVGSTGSLYIAGTTASADLPVLNAKQPQYGGGSSDAFWAVLSPDLNDVRALSFHGGSDREETTAVEAVESAHIVGWTASGDMPVLAAAQPGFGGGTEDAFLLELSDDRLLSATYFGGNGSDRAYGVAVAADRSVVTIGGETNSADLPAVREGVLRGASDGFSAQISSGALRALPVFGAKGFRTTAGLKIGPKDGRGPSSITITSSDPSAVLVAGNQTRPGQASIAFTAWSNTDVFWHAFWADCLVDTGGATLTISAPGYEDLTTVVRCSKPRLRIPASGEGALRVRFPQPVRLPLLIVPDAAALTPTQFLELVPRPGQPAAPIEVRVSSPAAARLNHTRVVPGTESFWNLTLEPLATGEVDVHFSAPDYILGESVARIEILSPAVAPARLTVARGYQALYFASAGPGTTPARRVTVTSGDPSKLLISGNSGRGGASWEGTTSGALPVLALQALASEGEVPVTLTVSGFDPAVTSVTLTEPRAYLSSDRPLENLKTGELASLTVRIETGAPGSSAQMPMPGQPAARVGLSLQPPGLAELSANTAEIGSSGSATIQLKALSPGSAVLTLTKVDTLDVAPVALPVRIVSSALRRIEIDLGNNLSTPVQVPLPFVHATPATMTVRSSDPSAVLVSATAAGMGSPEAAVTAPASATVAQFYVHGLKSSGTAQVSVEFPPFGSTAIDVRLQPSGIGWASDSVQTLLYGRQPDVRLQAFALDADSLSPVAAQALRPGVPSTVVRLASADPAVAGPAQDSVDVARGASSVALRANALGQTRFTLEQPPGFTAPSIRRALRVLVERRSLLLSPVNVAKHTVFPVRVTGTESGPSLPPVVIASGDPARLLVSHRPDAKGEPSIRIEQSFFTEFYVHALSGDGSVEVTAAADNFKSAAASIGLVPVGIAAAVSPVREAVWSAGKLYMTPRGEADVQLRLVSVDPDTGNVLMAGLTPHAGAGPWQADVRASNTGVFQLSGSTVTVPAHVEQKLQIRPAGLGEAEIVVSQPSGFQAPADGRIIIVVTDTLPPP